MAVGKVFHLGTPGNEELGKVVSKDLLLSLYALTVGFLKLEESNKELVEDA